VNRTNQSGDRSAENLGDNSPSQDTDAEHALAQALADYVDLISSEHPVDIGSFCRRHPGLEAALRREIETLHELDVFTECPPESEAVDSHELPIGRLSGNRILSEIGSGGMGRVFLAVDERLGRKVAIKTLKAQYTNHPTLRERFMREARAMARLSHPNIVQIYNLGEPHETPHFVMEYLEGSPLTEVARPLPLRQKVELVQKVVLAVEFLHQHNLLHRDLKPANILVGPDLDPKLLDFGLALEVGDLESRVTHAGAIVGTPDYFSPEQTRGDTSLDPRSDVFSLGTILYQVLTGSLPFHGESPMELIGAIRDREPVLPRRLNSSLPRALQNICLKALEKNPAERYNSAREMAEDIERYLAGQEVLGVPASYSRLIAGRIEGHLRELDGWKNDQVVSDSEYDALRKAYGRLTEPEDAWIMETRRLSFSQVSLYLGAWLLVVGAALVFLFKVPALSGPLSVFVVSAVAVPTAYLGIRSWKTGQFRFSIAYLLAFCLLLPVALLVTMGEYGIFSAFTKGRQDLELFYRFDSFKKTTNAQLWWALLLSLPVYVWLRQFTRSSVFSLVFAVMAALFSLVTLLRLGMLEWFDNDPGRIYFHLIPIALAFFVAAFALERSGRGADSRYFYPLAVTFTFAALSGVALFHEPYAKWLQSVAPWTRGQIEYLFIINAGIYLLLQSVFERFHSSQLRMVAKSFRFVIPGHVMTSLLLLGLEASRLWDESPAQIAMRREARTFEILLPIVACAFVFGSIPKQMKNFFATGLFFLAIGIVRLQQDFFHSRATWPIALLVVGITLMLGASRSSYLRLAMGRRVQRKAGPATKTPPGV
jgi:predicted Ser/Thr protein kinase